jgi:hypothetical protein
LKSLNVPIDPVTRLPFGTLPCFFPSRLPDESQDHSPASDSEQSLIRILRSAVLFVGLHPDQATEGIVDVAIQMNIAFAVVPCCVFPDLFPHRPNVKTTRDFVTYLQSKSDGVTRDFLNVNGRNVVVFAKGNLLECGTS